MIGQEFLCFIEECAQLFVSAEDMNNFKERLSEESGEELRTFVEFFTK